MRSLGQIIFLAGLGLALSFSSGCRTLLIKPSEWASNLAESSKNSSTTAPAERTQPIHLGSANANSFTNQQKKPGFIGQRGMDLEALETIQPSQATDLEREARFIGDSAQRMATRKQLPDLLELELQPTSFDMQEAAKKAAAFNLNQYSHEQDTHTSPSAPAYLQGDSRYNAEVQSSRNPVQPPTTPLDDLLANHGTSNERNFAYPTESVQPNQSSPAVITDTIHHASNGDSPAIRLYAAPVSEGSSGPTRSNSRSNAEHLFDADVENDLRSREGDPNPSPINSNWRSDWKTSDFQREVYRTEDIDCVVRTHPITFATMGDDQTTQTLALAAWDANQETIVLRNEHVMLDRNAVDEDRPISGLPSRWEELLKKTVEAMEKQQVELPMQRRADIQAALQSRLLRLSAGDVEGALQPIPGLSARENSFWHHQIAAMSAVLDSSTDQLSQRTLHPSSALEALQSIRNAQMELAALAPLRIIHVELCESVEGFGQYEKKGTVFTAGDEAIVYCELANFSVNSHVIDGEKIYEAKLKAVSQWLDADGQIVAQQDYPIVNDTSRNVRTDFYLHFPIRVPNIDPGNYQLNIAIEDVSACKRAMRMQPITVEALNSKQAQTAELGVTEEASRR
ncbi:MAG TPA: hypothetical protein PKD64_10600 [Pirellulaceae bacterium]|nr:hypothetical protein [Pirellulaceae bacterium]HMO92630.1 hypothetical protein [Pirellulaceae bacterium]HMP70222.1 hypothetical protein [Pirellulaceae bacterium]